MLGRLHAERSQSSLSFLFYCQDNCLIQARIQDTYWAITLPTSNMEIQTSGRFTVRAVREYTMEPRNLTASKAKIHIT